MKTEKTRTEKCTCTASTRTSTAIPTWTTFETDEEYQTAADAFNKLAEAGELAEEE